MLVKVPMESVAAAPPSLIMEPDIPRTVTKEGSPQEEGKAQNLGHKSQVYYGHGSVKAKVSPTQRNTGTVWRHVSDSSSSSSCYGTGDVRYHSLAAPDLKPRPSQVYTSRKSSHCAPVYAVAPPPSTLHTSTAHRSSMFQRAARDGSSVVYAQPRFYQQQSNPREWKRAVFERETPYRTAESSSFSTTASDTATAAAALLDLTFSNTTNKEVERRDTISERIPPVTTARLARQPPSEPPRFPTPPSADSEVETEAPQPVKVKVTASTAANGTIAAIPTADPPKPKAVEIVQPQRDLGAYLAITSIDLASRTRQLLLDVPTTDTACKCKNTHCLKLYCTCFQTGTFCDPALCVCKGCENLQDFNGPDGTRPHAITEILKRRIDAFEPRRKKKTGEGCACKKSRCVMKYCDCFAIGALCSSACSCERCENSKTATKCSKSSKGKFKLRRI